MPLPDAFGDEEAAPLLCAGIIGYRALRAGQPPRGRPPRDLRLRWLGPSHGADRPGPRRPRARHDPLARGPSRWPSRWVPPAQGAADRAPRTARLRHPVRAGGHLVPPALAALDRGGTLAIAGIHLSDIPPLDYARHLFEERTLRSVTANTRPDGEEFLAEAARIGVHVTTVRYPMAGPTQALRDLRRRPGQRSGRPDERELVQSHCIRNADRERAWSQTRSTRVRRSADGAPVDSRQSAVTGPLAIGPGFLDWGTHAGSAIRR